MGEGIVPRAPECDRCRELLEHLPTTLRDRLEWWLQTALEAATRDAALARATTELAELTGAGRCSLLIPCGRSALRIVASSDRSGVGDLLIRLDRYPELAHVLATGRSLLVADVNASEVTAGVAEPLAQAGVVSIATAPCRLGELDGLLRLVSRFRPLTELEHRVLVAAAHLAEHALEGPVEPFLADPRWTELAVAGWDAVLDLRADGSIASILEPRAARLGLAARDLNGTLLDDLLVAPDGTEAGTRIAELLHRPTDVLLGIRLPGGKISPIRVCTARDVDPLGRTLIGLSLQTADEEGQERGFGALPVPVLELEGPDGRIRSTNLAAARLAETSVEGLLGRRLEEILSGPDADRRLAVGGQRFIPVEVLQGPTSSSGLTPVVLTDRRREAETLRREAALRATVRRQLSDLEAAERRLDTMEAARATFLSASAHEFKTPLTVVQSYLEILLHDLGEGLSTQQLAFLRIAFESVMRLKRLVVDLTDLAALESGRMQMEIGEVDLSGRVATVLEEMRPLASRASIELTGELPADLPRARADGERIEQVLRNLLDNAIKYTPAGGRVWIEAAAGEDSVVLTIRDTGIGIGDEALSAIFDEFYRADHRGLGRRHGAGLGLTICRRIMSALGGRIAVSSATGSGSAFSIWLPRWPAPDEDR